MMNSKTHSYFSCLAVQRLGSTSDFEESCLLIRCDCLVCNSCSSGQCFAVSATTLADCLRIPPRDGHPCPRLAVPLTGPAADFHRQVIQPPPRVPKQRQSRRYAPCLAHNRVGGWVTPAVLPHHRTYGSVYGGS